MSQEWGWSVLTAGEITSGRKDVMVCLKRGWRKRQLSSACTVSSASRRCSMGRTDIVTRDRTKRKNRMSHNIPQTNLPRLTPLPLLASDVDEYLDVSMALGPKSTPGIHPQELILCSCSCLCFDFTLGPDQYADAAQNYGNRLEPHPQHNPTCR